MSGMHGRLTELQFPEIPGISNTTRVSIGAACNRTLRTSCVVNRNANITSWNSVAVHNLEIDRRFEVTSHRLGNALL